MKKLKKEFITKSSESRLHNLEIPVIALTGGIATGKSTISEYLVALGLPIICADKLVKEIYGLKETTEFISSVAPESIENDQVNFKILRSLVFNDSKLKTKVENYIYSLLPHFFKKKSEELKAPYVIYDVPLLYEKKLDQLVDQVICVYASQEIQHERVAKRDKSSSEIINKILSSQLPIDFKKEKADFVIDNSEDISKAKEQALNIFNVLLKES